MISPARQAAPESPERLQARLAGILEVALDCIVTIDSDGHFIDFNPAAERTFGYRKSEVLGRRMSDLIVPPSLRARHDAGLQRLANGEAPHMLGQRIEITAMRRDGSELPVELAITRVAMGPGEPPVYTAHLRDITARKQAEAALLSLQKQLEERVEQRTHALRASEASLRESQEMFARSFHANPALMWVAQLPDGQLLEVNRAFEEGFGRPKSDVIGRTTLELGIWPEPELRLQFIDRLRTHGQVRDFETQLTCRSGVRTFVLSADRIEVAAKEALLVVATDITERRRREDAEAALARAEASYRSLFENALEGLYRTTADGRFEKANPALARMFGYASPAELISAVTDVGRTFYVDPQRRRECLRELERRDQIIDFQSEVYRKDGSRFWVSESVRTVRAPDGRLLYLEGLAIDVTAQRQAEQALAAAKEAADTANRAKSQFLASMSHELRTPLNGILGYTQILARDPVLGPAQQRGVQVIHQSAEHLLDLINDVLDLSKVEAGRLELAPVPCDLRALLSGVAELLAPRAHAQGLAFATDFASDLPATVLVDAHRLRQVLLNLLGNALKFTQKGSVLLSAQAPQSAAPESRCTVRFSVSDTGRGIAPEDVGRLFQPFVQLPRAHGAVDGTGLGLAISRSLVQALGGQIHLESKPGWGSRFWFDLELPLAPSTPTSTAADRRVTGYVGERKRLLVVDDHPANREVLARLLDDVGFSVITVASGEEALAACRRERFDAVLLDLRMEGLSGLETATRLRETHEASLRIIAVSASAYDLDRQACQQAGCDDFLSKPVRSAELWDVLGRHLSLVWRTEGVGRPREALTVVPFPKPGSPPPDALRELHELARAGDIVALRARAEDLRSQCPEHAEFAQQLLALASEFKLKAIRKLLASTLPAGDAHAPSR